MAILNPSFEDPGSYPGEADHWTLVTFVAKERIAGFGPVPHRSREDFERWTEWNQVFEPGELTIGVFDPKGEGVEDFEEAWNNDFFLFELPTGHVVVCPFGGGTIEDMETGWLSQPFAWQLNDIATSAGVFDGENREDFEEQWRLNEWFAWNLDDLVVATAVFDTADVEDFENGWNSATSI